MKPIWTPSHPEKTRMAEFIKFVGKQKGQSFANYQELHTWSLTHTDLFWETLCDFFALKFDTAPYQILNNYENLWDARWFTGAQFNFAQKLLSRRDAHPALISLQENQERSMLTYQQLYQEVAQCAAGLKALGLNQGDRVAAVMPNIPQTIIAMLATVSLGGIWSSCSPDFGAEAILDRLGQIDPKILFICDGHQYQGKIHPAETKINALHTHIASLKKLIICPHIDQAITYSKLPKAVAWDDFIKPASQCEFVSLPFDHPLCIMFSSGTTGKPKCIVHGAGGTLIQHIKELGLHTDLKAQDNLFFYTTCGWMMWNWMVSALALGSTITLYEGCPTFPETNHLFKIIENEQVTVFGTSAKYISSIEKAGVKPKETFNFKHLRCILSTGSPLLSQNFDYIYKQVKKDVQLSSISGGTDIISCFALGNPMLPVYKGELQSIGLGMGVAVFNEQGQPIQQAQGELVCLRPCPSMPLGFWNDPNKTAYIQAYFSRFPGIWAHGDFAEITEHQGLIIYGRSDAVLNPGGVRIGTAEIYRQVESIEGVLESLVIAQNWEEDVRIVLFVKLAKGRLLDEALINTIKQTLRKNASPRHVPAIILQVEDIPRTINGKIVELAVKQIVHNQEITNLHSIANPQALQYFKDREELK